MDISVGMLEEKLRKFQKGTQINTCCNVCHHGSVGGDTILTIEENLNQTYGYIELTLNASSAPDVKVTPDEKVFYDTELKRLNEVIKDQAKKIERYVEYINSNISQANRALNGRF